MSTAQPPSDEERELYRRFASLPDDALLAEAGVATLMRRRPLGGAPPSPAEGKAEADRVLREQRPLICRLLGRSATVRDALMKNELLDAVEKFATAVACLRDDFDPALAVMLSILAVRHGLRWLCPELATTP